MAILVRISRPYLEQFGEALRRITRFTIEFFMKLTMAKSKNIFFQVAIYAKVNVHENNLKKKSRF